MVALLKIIVVGNINVPVNDLDDFIIQSSDIDQLETILEENCCCTVEIVCDNQTLSEIAKLRLKHNNIDTVYVKNDQIESICPIVLNDANFDTIEIGSEKELMQRLYTQAMLCYFKQGQVYKKCGNCGFANSYFESARKACQHLRLLS